MATAVEAKIVEGLLTHFASLTLPAGVETAWPNIDFTPSSGAAYIRLSITQNTPVNDRSELEAEPMRQGLLQASVFWPEDRGLVEPVEVAATIRAHFTRGTKIDHDGVRIWILEEPTVAGDLQEPAWLQIPVLIPWRVYP